MPRGWAEGGNRAVSLAAGSEAVAKETGRESAMVPLVMVPLVMVVLLWAGGVGAAAGVSVCTCDLSPGLCDLNCCCDPDCSLSDPTNVFSFCLPGSTKLQRWSCLSSWLMFRSNTPYPTSNIAPLTPGSPALFCVLPTDSTLNYFMSPQTVSLGGFSAVSGQYSGASFSPVSESNPTVPSFYKAGDPIFTISPSGTLGQLRQPTAVGHSNICSFSNSARFLQSVTTSCLRVINSVSGSCLTDPTLSSEYFYRNITVIGANPTGTVSASQRVPIISLMTDTPILQGNTCNNVVAQVNYTLRYNGTGEIVSVTVSFTLINVSGPSVSLVQSFGVLYESVSSVTPGTVRSGNPGYLVGLPVLTDAGPLLVPRSLGGSCSSSPVGFGVNTLSGCTIRAQGAESCGDVSNRAHSLLLGANVPQAVASFGNAVASQSGQWVPIIYQNCSTQPPGNCTSCPLPVSLTIQILHASVGQLSNPQSQVLGVRFHYSCQLVQCQDTTILQTQVTFSDVTQRGPPPRSSAPGHLHHWASGANKGSLLALVLVGYLLQL
ncbi:tectonic-3 [Xenopus laevis]|uniref:Tectonic-3 n=1 Tax=Xenopus laevis TaxID=8355 RepID=A0A8J0U5E0_XENLA|nr:tectonic-3 [Xenopus laevis]OCT57506.1 hypothetical protein XELAEV_18003384mg [Xenopus laevis]